MDFSIIIVNYNTFELTKNCIQAIFKNFAQEKFEIILVDNNSSDQSVEKLQDIFGVKIKIIANKDNLGFGKANNQGAKSAKGKYLFFLNSDTMVTTNILELIKKEFEQNKELGIICPKLVLEDGQEQDYAYGKFPKIINLVSNKFFNSKFEILNSKLFVDWVSGAAMIVRKDIFDKVDGFDENIFMYFEDIDLCKRIKDLGYKIIYFLDTSIIHFGGKSFEYFTKQKNIYYKSQNYFYKKHYGLCNMFLMRIIRFPYKFLTIILNK